MVQRPGGYDSASDSTRTRDAFAGSHRPITRSDARLRPYAARQSRPPRGPRGRHLQRCAHLLGTTDSDLPRPRDFSRAPATVACPCRRTRPMSTRRWPQRISPSAPSPSRSTNRLTTCRGSGTLPQSSSSTFGKAGCRPGVVLQRLDEGPLFALERLDQRQFMQAIQRNPLISGQHHAQGVNLIDVLALRVDQRGQHDARFPRHVRIACLEDGAIASLDAFPGLALDVQRQRRACA